MGQEIVFWDEGKEIVIHRMNHPLWVCLKPREHIVEWYGTHADEKKWLPFYWVNQVRCKTGHHEWMSLKPQFNERFCINCDRQEDIE